MAPKQCSAQNGTNDSEFTNLSSALAANLAARAAARSSSVHFLMVILSVDSDFFSTFAGVSVATGASILAGLCKNKRKL